MKNVCYFLIEKDGQRIRVPVEYTDTEAGRAEINALSKRTPGVIKVIFLG